MLVSGDHERKHVAGDWDVWGLCCFWHLECWLHCDWTSHVCATLLWAPAYACSIPYCSGLINSFFIENHWFLRTRKQCFLYLLELPFQFSLLSFFFLETFSPPECSVNHVLLDLYYVIIMVKLLCSNNEKVHLFLSLFLFNHFRMSVLQYLRAYPLTSPTFYVSALRR